MKHSNTEIDKDTKPKSSVQKDKRTIIGTWVSYFNGTLNLVCLLTVAENLLPYFKDNSREKTPKSNKNLIVW